jgi:hypothetical protein
MADFSNAKPVYLVVPPKLDIKQTEQVTAKALGLLGCPRCHSGFDIRWLEEQVILVDKQLGVGPAH